MIQAAKDKLLVGAEIEELGRIIVGVFAATGVMSIRGAPGPVKMPVALVALAPLSCTVV